MQATPNTTSLHHVTVASPFSRLLRLTALALESMISIRAIRDKFALFAFSVLAVGTYRYSRVVPAIASTASPPCTCMTVWLRRREASHECIVAADHIIVWRVLVVVIWIWKVSLHAL